MQTIRYNKKQLGEWRRDDGELKKNVNEEAMFREIAKLINDGWIVVRTSGITHVQMIEVEKK
ncbi:MAG: hypothetical protein ABWY25_07665 [Paenisporosarcina sp.]